MTSASEPARREPQRGEQMNSRQPATTSTVQREDPREGSIPPFPEQQQELPGLESEMRPRPDYGEQTYVGGSGRLAGLATLITGGDSGIGRAVALAYAREGADVVISYLNEDEDARETCRVVEEAGRRAIAIPGDIGDEAHCREIVERTVRELGRIDVLVNNAAHQYQFGSFEEMTSEEWEKTFRINLHAMFYLAKAAVPHMKPGASIINTTSIQEDRPTPGLLPYSTTKGAIVTFTMGLAQLLADKGIRVNAVAPGPVWTPLIPASMPPEKVSQFGKSSPLGRPAQPVELAPIYVLLASPEASYVNGAVWPVTGGQPMS
jgi:NAD(P)-dependent dehydrogenase (short-subunit alcohol dehydrogenase family)